MLHNMLMQTRKLTNVSSLWSTIVSRVMKKLLHLVWMQHKVLLALLGSYLIKFRNLEPIYRLMAGIVSTNSQYATIKTAGSLHAVVSLRDVKRMAKASLLF